MELTRSRAYRKNDQAWIEQKNGSVIRRFVGHERHSGAVAGQTMAHLYSAVRLYVNYFQPSFQLLAKNRNGGSVTKHYSNPATPCDRLLDRDDVSDEIKHRLRKSRSELDPVSLLHSIRECWQQLVLSSQGANRMGRVWRASCRSCPICGNRERYGRHTPGEHGLLAPGGLVQTRSKVCGARS